ncbi:MAG: ABC transporter permease, partial [Chloroflexi bacterium]|nr:ABC transporter permease [Chloroflexota bacterium]
MQGGDSAAGRWTALRILRILPAGTCQGRAWREGYLLMNPATGKAPSHPSYDSARRPPAALEELRGVFKYRDLIYLLVHRDVVTRYKRSVLGIAWTMINPLGTMLVLTVVFSQLFHAIEGYPVYVLSGLLAWTFFSQTTVSSLTQTIWGGSLFHRIYLPRTTFAVSAIGAGLVNAFLTLFPMAAIMLLVGVPLRATMLFVPVSLMILAAFALGVGLLVSTVAVNFPDVVEMFQVLLMAWMYLTPVIYPPEIIPDV